MERLRSDYRVGRMCAIIALTHLIPLLARFSRQQTESQSFDDRVIICAQERAAHILTPSCLIAITESKAKSIFAMKIIVCVVSNYYMQAIIACLSVRSGHTIQSSHIVQSAK